MKNTIRFGWLCAISITIATISFKKAHSQTCTTSTYLEIAGYSNVCTNGVTQYTYTAVGYEGSVPLNWYITGGTVVNSTANSATVVWTSDYGNLYASGVIERDCWTEPDPPQTYCYYDCFYTNTLYISPFFPYASSVGAPTFCEGESITLYTSATEPGLTYQWKKDGANINGATAATYSASQAGAYKVAVNQNGCVVETNSVNVTVLTKPAPLTATASPTQLVPGSTVVSATAGLNYQWRKDGVIIPGATEMHYVATRTGSYSVSTTGANGCSSVSNTINVSGGNNTNFSVSNSLLIPGIVSESQLYAQPLNNGGNEGYVTQEITYSDNLGKEIQAISRQAAPGLLDVIQPGPNVDGLGREKTSFLPMVGSQNTGLFINNPVNQGGNYTQSVHYNFYNQASQNIARETHPFAEMEYEPSPLSRIIKQGSIGSHWQLGGENVKMEYGTNIADDIRKWTINSTTGLPESATKWPQGALRKSKSYEVSGSTPNYPQSETYADIRDQKVVDRTWKDASAFNETYYVYDTRGNLCYVLPPALLVELGITNPSVYPTPDQLDRWAYQYQYDKYNRPVAFKAPGADWEYTVYDKRDRPVLSQSGNQRLINQWSFIKYDELDRPVITGLYNPGAALTREALQATVDALDNGKGYQNTVLKTESVFEGRTGVDIIAVQYDGYREYRASNSVSLQPGFSFAASSQADFRAYISNGTGQGTSVFPTDNIENLTLSYYDNYKVNDAVFLSPDFQFIQEAWPVTSNDQWAITDRVVGQMTGSSVKVVGQEKWLHTVTYYDKRGRVIQVISSNHLGGVVRASSLYNFAGKTLATLTHESGNYDITWQNLVNASVTGTTLSKTSATAAWNAGASSVQQLPAGTNGYIETTVTSTTSVVMIGLSDSDPDAGNTSIDYGFLLNGTVLEVHENGATKFTGIAGSLSTGDVLRIQRLGTTIYYLKNNKIVYVSVVPSTTALLADVSIFSVNGLISAVRASFTLQGISFVNGTRLAQRFDYDHAGRLLKTWHRINLQPEVLLAQHEYNALGQLVDKKIHSTNNGSNFLQSVDYRYHIKGWLKSINNVSADDGESDYFAAEYHYNDATNAGNTARFDGLISAMRWKHDRGTKERLYNYSYDNLKQLTHSAYKARISSTDPTWALHPDRYTENGLTYDNNGNILTLSRFKEKGTSKVDELTYNYGSPKSNRLLAVTDNAPAATRALGFVDGNTTGNDYAYDANGNLVHDLNKGITSISYNHLNMPVSVTFSDNSYITYTYDATGARLSQAYFNNAAQPVFKTDYNGEFVYLNGELTLIFHEEGRIVPPGYQNLVANKEANGTEGFTPSGNVTLSAETLNGQTYVKAVCNQTTGTPGIFPIGPNYSVNPGEKYSFKILGYRGTSANAYLKVTGNGNPANIVWTGALLPQGETNENWVTTEFIVPAGVTQIQIGVQWSNPALNETFYINRVALYKVDWEYQYFISDHLGSTRVVLGTDPTTINLTATFETEAAATENQQWLNIDYSKVVPHATANATPGGNEVVRMNNTYRVGPARSIKVFPGDVINASVKAYYTSASGFTQAPLATIVNAVASVLVGGNPAITNEINYAYSNSNQGNGSLLLAPYQGSNKPSAFINYILFDEEYKVVEAKSAPVGAANAVHLVTLPAILVKELGYLFVYLSYDNESAHWVHFDELKISHYESPVLQVNTYYPFGMPACTWLRDGEKENLYNYQGKEYDSLTRWHDFHARQYDAEIGRMWSNDPQAAKMAYISNYAAMMNNPVLYVDPDGELPFIPILLTAIKFWGYTQAIFNVMRGYSENGWRGAAQALAGTATSMAIGAAVGAMVGGILPDYGNIKGAIPGGLVGGLSGAVSGGLTGGITASIGGGNFWDGFRSGAIGGGLTGSLAGSHWGYINAKNAGKNVWWGNDVGHNRTQTSFFNYDKPDVYRSPIRSTGGSKIAGGCVPKCLENTGLLYGRDEYYFASEYASFTGRPFAGVSTYDVEQFIESLPGPLFVDRPKLEYLGNHINSGKRLIGAMMRYISPNSSSGSTSTGTGHAMNLKKLKVWSNGNFKMIFINPDGGGRFIVNRVNYNRVYGPWVWYAIYR